MMVFATQSSFSASDAKIDFVENIYQTGKQLEKGDELIQLYADEGLQHAIKAREHWYSKNEGDMCEADGYDRMWQSNDSPYHRPLSFKNIGNNKIKVNLGKVQFYDASWVTYTLNCKGNVCKISDVIDENGSLKKNIYKYCS